MFRGLMKMNTGVLPALQSMNEVWDNGKELKISDQDGEVLHSA